MRRAGGRPSPDFVEAQALSGLEQGRGATQQCARAASKGGIVQLTKSQALAWAKDNIQVNAILPGWFETDLTRKAREEVKSSICETMFVATDSPVPRM